jgi:capsular exopolysaccharide synthesis family protein
MTTKQIPIDLNVLGVIAHRYTWLLVALTFVSFAFSSFVVASLIKLYNASVTIFVNPERLMEDILGKTVIVPTLGEQLETIRQQVLSDDFIEINVISGLNLRLEDVNVPPLRLKFMAKVVELAEPVKNMVKKVTGGEVYTLTEDQKKVLRTNEMILAIKKNIKIRQDKNILLIISYDGLSPVTARRVVEIIANQSKEYLLRNKLQESREVVRYLKSQNDEVTQKLKDLESELALKKVADFDKGPEAKIAFTQERQKMLDSVGEIQQNLALLAAKKQPLMTKMLDRETILRRDPDMMVRLGNINRSQDALTLEKLETRLAELRKTYTDEWPEVIRVKEEIDQLKQAMQAKFEGDPEAEKKVFLADPFYSEYYRQIGQIESEETSLKQQEQKLNDKIGVYGAKLLEMPEVERSFGEFQRNINLHSNRQLDIAEKLQTAESTLRLIESRIENQIRIVNRSFPTTPSGPSAIILMIGLWMLGPLTGIGLIILLYYLNSTVKSVDDVQKEYNLPVIAVIPRTNFRKALKRHRQLLKTPTDDQGLQAGEFSAQIVLPEVTDPHPQEIELLCPLEMTASGQKVFKRVCVPVLAFAKESAMVTMLTNPESQAAEEYRRLCFNIEWGIEKVMAGLCKTIMVTSALPNEGKTITAVNLATSLARHHNVLLIDANFRKPSIHKNFGISHAKGLSDMLANPKETPELYVIPSSPNLSILTAGTTLTAPADLLSSNLMSDFIGSVKSSSYFQYAIFDVPPVVQIPDASILASQLDGIVWVIWELQTSQEIVRLALTRITNPAILGVVLNHSEQRPLPKKYDKFFAEYQQRGAMHPQHP